MKPQEGAPHPPTPPLQQQGNPGWGGSRSDAAPSPAGITTLGPCRPAAMLPGHPDHHVLAGQVDEHLEQRVLSRIKRRSSNSALRWRDRERTVRVQLRSCTPRGATPGGRRHCLGHPEEAGLPGPGERAGLEPARVRPGPRAPTLVVQLLQVRQVAQDGHAVAVRADAAAGVLRQPEHAQAREALQVEELRQTGDAVLAQVELAQLPAAAHGLQGGDAVDAAGRRPSVPAGAPPPHGDESAAGPVPTCPRLRSRSDPAVASQVQGRAQAQEKALGAGEAPPAEGGSGSPRSVEATRSQPWG